MEKKEVLILAVLLLLTGFNLYRRYVRKKDNTSDGGTTKAHGKSSLSVQPDDYEPYSGRKE